MAGLSSYMLCLYAFPCEQAPRQKPKSTSFIPMELCHDKKQKHKKQFIVYRKPQRGDIIKDRV